MAGERHSVTLSGMVESPIAWIDVSVGPPLAPRLEAARGAEARVVVLDASAGVAQAVAAEAVDLVRYALPVVFAFEGALVGPAAALALAADIRVCSSHGSLAGPFRTERRLRTLGGSRAASLFASGEPVGAQVLHSLGLVNAVSPPHEADVEARRIAGVIASRGPIATRLAKEAIWRGLPQPLEQGLRFETDLTLLLQTTKDRAEGVRAFLEKRQPVFKGE